MSSKGSLVGMARPGLYKAESRDGLPAFLSDAIFPIVSQAPDGTFIPIGTGFFIAEHGIFATAAHVVQAVLDTDGKPNGPFGLFQLTSGNQYLIRPILTATRHLVADVAVGIAAPMHHIRTGEPLRNKILTLASMPPKIGTLACTYAYPKTTVIPGKPQQVRFTPGYFEGLVRDHYPDGRDSVMLPGACYGTTIVLHGAASGGPVFDSNGHVFGVNSTGYDDAPISFVACLSSIFDLSLDNVALPGDPRPKTVTIQELVEKGCVVRPHVNRET